MWGFKGFRGQFGEIGHLNIFCGIDATEKKHEREIGSFKGSA